MSLQRIKKMSRGKIWNKDLEIRAGPHPSSILITFLMVRPEGEAFSI